MASKITLRAFLLTAAFAIVACGGGGGGGGDPVALFNGVHYLVGVSGENDPGPEVRSTWGTVTSGGLGVMDTAIWHNASGVPEGPQVETGTPYLIGEDRGVTIVDPMDPAKTRATGRIAASGAVLALGSTQGGSEPGMWITALEGGTFSDASLNGAYHYCGFGFDPGSGADTGTTGIATFDGNGTVTLAATENREGIPSSEGGSVGYSVGTDGSVTFDLAAPQSVRGGILAGGNLVVVAGLEFGPSYPIVLIFIPMSSNASPSLVSPEYFITGLEADISSGDYESITGLIVTDGKGGYTAHTTRNEEGVISGDPTTTGNYVLESDGRISITTPGGTYRGGLSPDGAFAVLGGPLTANDNPALFFLLR